MAIADALGLAVQAGKRGGLAKSEQLWRSVTRMEKKYSEVINDIRNPDDLTYLEDCMDCAGVSKTVMLLRVNVLSKVSEQKKGGK